MILASLSQAAHYSALHPLFPQVFAYIDQHDLFAHETGRFPLQGDDLIMIVERVKGRQQYEAKLECHRRYIDIQLVLDGVDTMGWAPLDTCHSPLDEFNTEKDIQFFSDPVSSWITTHAGQFCIFFPSDAHAPLVSDDIIHKVIFKVAVSL